MAKSGDSGEYSVRSLAEILQEHGLETEFGTRPGRRRKDEERKADWPARPSAASQPYTRLRPAPEPAPEPRPRTAPPRAAAAPAAARPSAAAPAPAGPSAAKPYAEILREHGLETEFGTRPDRRQRDGRGSTERSAATTPPQGSRRQGPAGPATPAPGPAGAQSAPRSGRGAAPAARTPSPAPAPRSPTPPGSRGVDPPATRGPAPKGPPDVPMYGRRSTDVPLPPDLAPGAMPPASGPSTAAIPALRATRRSGATDPDDGGSGGRPGAPAGPEGALAWARFAGEMVLAVAAGVGVYLAFTVLWELLPYVALVAAPLIVTGLVAGASAWRERRGQGPVGVRLLAVLLFAGAVLVVAPAAQLLAAG